MKRRGPGRRPTARGPEQPALFDDPDEMPVVVDSELERDVHRMRLETSSNVYAQRLSTW